MYTEQSLEGRGEIHSILPHRPPFVFVDTIESLAEKEVWARVCVRHDNIFLDTNECLAPVAFIEMMAQCAAALGASEEVSASMGYLAAVRSLCIRGTAHVGDILRIHIQCTAQVGNISVIEGRVLCGEVCLATGQLKLFVEQAHG